MRARKDVSSISIFLLYLNKTFQVSRFWARLYSIDFRVHLPTTPASLARTTVFPKINFDCNLKRRLMSLFICQDFFHSKLIARLRKRIHWAWQRIFLCDVLVHAYFNYFHVIFYRCFTSRLYLSHVLWLGASYRCRWKLCLNAKKLFKQNCMRCNIGSESTRFFYPLRGAFVMQFNIYGWLNII